jgi:hypothetical protein
MNIDVKIRTINDANNLYAASILGFDAEISKIVFGQQFLPQSWTRSNILKIKLKRNALKVSLLHTF